MSDDTRIFVYAGSFADADAAVHAVDAAHALHKAGKIRLVEAGAFMRTPDCDVKMLKSIDPAIGKGAGVGLVTGALVGLLFPPALLSVPFDSAVGAALGAVVGTFHREFSRETIKSLGDQLDQGEAGAFVVAKDVVAHVTSLGVLPGATARVRHEVEDPKALSAAVAELAFEPKLSRKERKAVKEAKAAKKAAKKGPASKSAKSTAKKSLAKPAAKSSAKLSAKTATKKAAKKPVAKTPSKKAAAKS